MAAYRSRYLLMFALLWGGCQSKKTVESVISSEALAADDDSGVQEEIAAIKARLDLNEAMTRLLKETVGLHESRIAALEQKTSDLEANMKAVNDRVSALQTSLNTITLQISNTNQQLTASNLSRAERKKLEDQIKVLMEQQAAQQTQLFELQARTTALEVFRADQESWNAQMNSQIAAISQSIGDLQQRMSDTEFNVSLMADAVDDLTRSLLNLKDRMSFAEAEQKRILAHLLATEQELGALKTDILNAVRGEIATLSENLQAAIEALLALIAKG